MTKVQIADYARKLITNMADGDTLCQDATGQMLLAHRDAVKKGSMKFVVIAILQAAYWQGHYDAEKRTAQVALRSMKAASRP